MLMLGWTWVFAQPLSGNVVVKSLMHSEGQKEEASDSMWIQGLKTLCWKWSRHVYRRATIVNLGLKKKFPQITCFQRGAILFYCLQPDCIKLLVAASGTVVTVGPAESILSTAPAWELSKEDIDKSLILKSPSLFPISSAHKNWCRNFDAMKTALLCQWLILGPSMKEDRLPTLTLYKKLASGIYKRHISGLWYLTISPKSHLTFFLSRSSNSFVPEEIQKLKEYYHFSHSSSLLDWCHHGVICV